MVNVFEINKFYCPLHFQLDDENTRRASSIGLLCCTFEDKL